MSKKCHCKKAGECEECPEWIFTFADLVMLMMGFFVILWVLKPNPGKDNPTQGAAEDKWMNTIAEIRMAFGYEPNPSSNDPVDKWMIHHPPRSGSKQGAETNTPRESASGTDAVSTTIRDGKHSAVGGHVNFEAGETVLSPAVTKSLDEIAEQLRGHYNIVYIKGNSSRDDLSDGGTPQRLMELSLKRAQVVQDYLVSKGVSPETLRVQGSSTSEPVKQRAYGANSQAVNRRVEVEVSSSLVEDRQDNGNKRPPAASSASGKPAGSEE